MGILENYHLLLGRSNSLYAYAGLPRRCFEIHMTMQFKNYPAYLTLKNKLCPKTNQANLRTYYRNTSQQSRSLIGVQNHVPLDFSNPIFGEKEIAVPKLWELCTRIAFQYFPTNEIITEHLSMRRGKCNLYEYCVSFVYNAKPPYEITKVRIECRVRIDTENLRRHNKLLDTYIITIRKEPRSGTLVPLVCTWNEERIHEFGKFNPQKEHSRVILADKTIKKLSVDYQVTDENNELPRRIGIRRIIEKYNSEVDERIKEYTFGYQVLPFTISENSVFPPVFLTRNCFDNWKYFNIITKQAGVYFGYHRNRDEIEIAIMTEAALLHCINYRNGVDYCVECIRNSIYRHRHTGAKLEIFSSDDPNDPYNLVPKEAKRLGVPNYNSYSKEFVR